MRMRSNSFLARDSIKAEGDVTDSVEYPWPFSRSLKASSTSGWSSAMRIRGSRVSVPLLSSSAIVAMGRDSWPRIESGVSQIWAGQLPAAKYYKAIPFLGLQAISGHTSTRPDQLRECLSRIRTPSTYACRLSLLFIPQCHHRVHTHCAPGWDVAGKQDNCEQGQDYCGERKRIRGRHPEQETREKMRESERGDQPQPHTKERQTNSLPYDQTHHLAGLRPQSYANADFVGSLRD